MWNPMVCGYSADSRPRKWQAELQRYFVLSGTGDQAAKVRGQSTLLSFAFLKLTSFPAWAEQVLSHEAKECANLQRPCQVIRRNTSCKSRRADACRGALAPRPRLRSESGWVQSPVSYLNKIDRRTR